MQVIWTPCTQPAMKFIEEDKKSSLLFFVFFFHLISLQRRGYYTQFLKFMVSRDIEID